MYVFVYLHSTFFFSMHDDTFLSIRPTVCTQIVRKLNIEVKRFANSF